MRKSWEVGLVAILAVVCATWYLPLEPWCGWAVYLESIEGIILGALAVFSAVFLGGSCARIIKHGVDWMFGVIVEPIGILLILENAKT